MKKAYLSGWLIVVPALIIAITIATVSTFFADKPFAWFCGLIIIMATTAIEVRLVRRQIAKSEERDLSGSASP